MTIEYRELLAGVSRTTGLDTDAAKKAAEATLAALALTVDQDGRERLFSALPGDLRIGADVTDEPRHWDEATFVRAVAMLSRQPAEQARLQAQAVLAGLAQQEPDLIERLPAPEPLRALFTPPQPPTA